MAGFFERVRRFLAELKRRKVYRVALAYLAAGFVGLEALDLLVPATALPSWAPSLFVALAVLGFPVAVVLAWAVEITPEGVKWTERAEGASRPAGGLRIGLVAGALLLLVAGGVWWSAAAPRGPARADADLSSRVTLAVLPFTAFGPGVEQLHEGMVSLLSTALDGAGGVRAIDQRTVLSRWDGALGAGADPDRATALEVARHVGAEWAVLGSVTSVGEDARFAARIVWSGTGESMGEVTVEGHLDSLLVTIDELTREVLEVVLARSGADVSAVSMTSLTTQSVEALKAFLDGERHYREGRLDSAIVAYGRAAEEDSTFALAQLRYAIAHSWMNMTSLEPSSLERAYRHRPTGFRNVRGLPWWVPI